MRGRCDLRRCAEIALHPATAAPPLRSDTEPAQQSRRRGIAGRCKTRPSRTKVYRGKEEPLARFARARRAGRRYPPPAPPRKGEGRVVVFEREGGDGCLRRRRRPGRSLVRFAGRPGLRQGRTIRCELWRQPGDGGRAGGPGARRAEARHHVASPRFFRRRASRCRGRLLCGGRRFRRRAAACLAVDQGRGEAVPRGGYGLRLGRGRGRPHARGLAGGTAPISARRRGWGFSSTKEWRRCSSGSRWCGRWSLRTGETVPSGHLSRNPDVSGLLALDCRSREHPTSGGERVWVRGVET